MAVRKETRYRFTCVYRLYPVCHLILIENASLQTGKTGVFLPKNIICVLNRCTSLIEKTRMPTVWNGTGNRCRSHTPSNWLAKSLPATIDLMKRQKEFIWWIVPSRSGVRNQTSLSSYIAILLVSRLGSVRPFYPKHIIYYMNIFFAVSACYYHYSYELLTFLKI